MKVVCRSSNFTEAPRGEMLKHRYSLPVLEVSVGEIPELEARMHPRTAAKPPLSLEPAAVYSFFNPHVISSRMNTAYLS